MQAAAAAAATPVSAATDAAAVSSSGQGAGVTLRVALDPACQLASVRAYMVLKRLRQLGEVVATEPSEIDIDEGRFAATKAQPQSIKYLK